eukprot:5999882-Pleurochrysis_carterae.AAC.1
MELGLCVTTSKAERVAVAHDEMFEVTLKEMSCNTTCYQRDNCNTRWHLVAIFGAFGRVFAKIFDWSSKNCYKLPSRGAMEPHVNFGALEPAPELANKVVQMTESEN